MAKDQKNIDYPLWLSLILYWLLTFVLLFVAVKNTNGHFGYPLDDTYIHMAIGKHFVRDGIWGVAQNGFSSSTSSPLWTFLIFVIYKLFGVNDWAPLALSLIFGSILIYFCSYVLRNYSKLIRLPLLLLLILFIPLPVLTLTGMEHTLHSLLTLLVIYYAATYLTKKGTDTALFIMLVILANLTTIARYEGLLLVFSVMLLFIIKKRYWEGALFGISSSLLVIVYGLISLANGWSFLPNSILLKGNTPPLTLAGLSVFVNRLLMNFYSSPHISVLIIACLGIYLWGGKNLENKEKYLVILVTLITVLHMQFAAVGWFFRYEAYLMSSLGLVLLDTLNKLSYQTETINKKTAGPIVCLALLIIMCIPLTMRSRLAHKQYPVAVKNIFEQHYQMGLFIQNYYSGRYVAANDIGAINYLSNIYILDLFGLANNDVAYYRLNDLFDEEILEQQVSSHDVPLIMIYNSWFAGIIPENWIEVGRWKISDNVVCGSDQVSFYATNDADKQELINNLIDFSNKLPASVDQSGIYLSP